MNRQEAQALQKMSGKHALHTKIALEYIGAQISEAAAMGLNWTFGRCQIGDWQQIARELAAREFDIDIVFESPTYAVLLIKW